MQLHIVLTLAATLTISSGSSFADGNAGSYLAARTAIIDNNFSEAATQFTRALIRDPRNPVLLENAMSAYLGLGDIERAVPLARRMNEVGAPSQISSMVLLGDAARRGAWDRLIEDIVAGQTVGPLFDGLARAWAELGAGQMSTAVASFDELIASNGVEAFGLYHKALALASVGDFESAAEIFSGESGTMITLTRRGIVAYAQVLSQLERNEDALELVSSGLNHFNHSHKTGPLFKVGSGLTFVLVKPHHDLHVVVPGMLGENLSLVRDGFVLLVSAASEINGNFATHLFPLELTGVLSDFSINDITQF